MRIWKRHDGESLSPSHEVWALVEQTRRLRATWWPRARVFSRLARSVTRLVVDARCELLNRGYGPDHFLCGCLSFLTAWWLGSKRTKRKLCSLYEPAREATWWNLYHDHKPCQARLEGHRPHPSTGGTPTSYIT